MSEKKFLISHGWWASSAIIGIVFFLTSAWVVPLAIALLFAIALESLVVILYLRGRERGALFAMLAIHGCTVLLAGGVLLFLERALFKIPLVGMTVFLLLFSHYTLRSAWMHKDSDLRVIVQDSMRLLAYASIFFFGALFFATLFYFDIGSAFFILPLLIVPFCISILHGWFDHAALRERMMIAVGAEILLLEAIGALMFLPVSYGFSAFVTLATYFLYDEYVSRPIRTQEEAHKNDRAISFVIITLVICLLVVIARWR